jgi:2'-5' RNA ligase
MRLFVGFTLSSGLVNKILEIQKNIKSNVGNIDGFRWMNREKLHITVVFLGKVEESNVAKVKSVIEAISIGKSEIIFQVKSFGLWPKGKNPRIISVQLNHPQTYACLQAELSLKLSPFAPNIRKLKPAHITIARISKKAKPRDLKELISAVDKIKFPLTKISVSSINLYQSFLSPKGSKYKII